MGGRCACGGVDFDRLILRYCDYAGVEWTDALENTLTWPRLMARFDYWRKYPPVAVALRMALAGFGVWKPPRETAPENQMDDLRALMGGNSF